LALYLHYTRREPKEESNQADSKGTEVDNKLNKLFAVIYYFASGYWFSFIGMMQYLAKTKTFKV
jgi:hypothetical protein